MMHEIILMLDPSDNVGVVLEPVRAGEACTVVGNPSLSVTAAEDIPFCHKISLRDLAQNDPIVKYGESLGTARVAVPKGAWVHQHNLDELNLL